jgi:hypothetical protein
VYTFPVIVITSYIHLIGERPLVVFLSFHFLWCN